ncbi:MAG: WbqC family protein [Flavobacteriales bacterium]|nr:WbqC family protein [Flavobacteriales bacterium]
MVVLPSCPFPNHLWYHNCLKSNTAVVDIHENYIKQSLRNRFYILEVHGKLGLTVPVEGQDGQKTRVKDIRIARGKWNKLHFTALKSAYGKSPFFEHFEDEFARFWERKFNFLVDFNEASVALINDWIGLEPRYTLSTEYVDPCAGDKRPSFKGPSPDASIHYQQVFSDRHAFVGNLSILDLVFNMGTETAAYLDDVRFS